MLIFEQDLYLGLDSDELTVSLLVDHFLLQSFLVLLDLPDTSLQPLIFQAFLFRHQIEMQVSILQRTILLDMHIWILQLQQHLKQILLIWFLLSLLHHFQQVEFRLVLLAEGL